MSAFKNKYALGTSPTVLFTLASNSPNKALLNVQLSNFSASTTTYVDLYDVLSTESTSSPPQASFAGRITLQVKGNPEGIIPVTGRIYVGGYSLVAISDSNNVTAIVDGEITLNLD